MGEKQAVHSFDIRVRREGDAHVIAIHGALADGTNTRAKELFLEVLGDLPSRLIVDLSDMDYVSSAGIGLLVSVLRRCRQRGLSMSVCGLKPEILDLFKITRLSQVFEIYETASSALLRRGQSSR